MTSGGWRLALLWLAAGLLLAAVGGRAQATASWTVMVYLDADNDLEAAGIGDVNQMEQAPATPGVSVLVQMDRIKMAPGNPLDDTSNGDWDTTRRYLIQPDSDPEIINSPMLADLGELNMGDPQTLVDFVTWGIQNYPAQHYALILWDHGSGWRALSSGLPAKNICEDDTNFDILTTAEASSALASVRASLGRKLDVLAADACIMGNVELAYAWKDGADYYVASEENVPYWGFSYGDFLSRVVGDPAMGGRELARALVSTYRASYDFGDQGILPVTMSAVDLSLMPSLASALTEFADALQAAVAADPSYGAQLHTWWEMAEIADDPKQVDLGYFARLVGAEAPTAGVLSGARDVQQAYQSSIVGNGVVHYTTREHTGLSIYYPFNSSVEAGYGALALAAETTWESFLWASPHTTDYVADAFEPDGTLAQAKAIPLCRPQGRHWFYPLGEVDVGAFTAEAGTQYVIQTEDLGRDCDTKLSLLAPTGEVLLTDDNGGEEKGASQLIWTCPASGTYGVSVQQSDSPLAPVAAGGRTVYDVFVSPITFPDVPLDFWAFRQIEACHQAGIVQGFAYDGTYRSTNTVTRGQMAAYIARALCDGEANVPTGPATPSFSDVTPDNNFYNHVEYLTSHGVVTGYSDGTYHPEWTVNRGQMAAFLARARCGGEDLVPPGPATPSFPDVPQDFKFYKHVEWIYANGITTGKNDGLYHPADNCLRDQMAVYVARAFGL